MAYIFFFWSDHGLYLYVSKKVSVSQEIRKPNAEIHKLTTYIQETRTRTSFLIIKQHNW